jgi:hypothetical protein
MSRGDFFGESLTAINQARKAGALPGSMFSANQVPSRFITNAYYLPIGYFQGESAMTTTATRCYYTPLTIWTQKSFAGVSLYNTSVGDNGEKFRIMVFKDDGSGGGPGTLEKDFGEITLTAAAALRTLSSSWNALPGTYWLACWCDSASSVEAMRPFAFTSLVGIVSQPSISNFIGDFTAPTTGGTGNLYTFCHYVDTAYGAAPSTAVAPTASLAGRANTVAAVAGTPAVWLKG